MVHFGNVRHDRVDTLINVGHPKDKYFELAFFLLNHIRAESQLDQLGAKLSTFLTAFIFFSTEDLACAFSSTSHFFGLKINVLIRWVLHIVK